MSRVNQRSNLVAGGSFALGKSLNFHTSTSPLSKAIKKRAFVLPRKNISSSVIESGGESRLILPISLFYKRDGGKKLEQTASRQPRGHSVLRFYGLFTNATEGLKLSIKDKLLMCLREKDGGTKRKSESVPFYKTHMKIRSHFKQRNVYSNRRKFAYATQCNDCIMPLISQVQYNQREAKKMFESTRRDQKTFYGKEGVGVFKSPKARSNQQCSASPFFFQRTLYKNSLYDFKAKNTNTPTLKKAHKFDPLEPFTSKEKQRLPPNKDTSFTCIRPKTRKCCYRTKRVVFSPRANTEHLPLVVMKFENVLGVVEQKCWASQGSFCYFVKPRTVNSHVDRTLHFSQTANAHTPSCDSLLRLHEAVQALLQPAQSQQRPSRRHLPVLIPPLLPELLASPP